MRIWRIEDQDGYGVYSSRTWNKEREDAWEEFFGYAFYEDCNGRHPTPDESFRRSHGTGDVLSLADRKGLLDHRHGFTSKTALLSWFTKEELMYLFSTLRFVLRVYHVPADKVVDSLEQAIFDRSSARRAHEVV